jgi:hypothetical protein
MGSRSLSVSQPQRPPHALRVRFANGDIRTEFPLRAFTLPAAQVTRAALPSSQLAAPSDLEPLGSGFVSLDLRHVI